MVEIPVITAFLVSVATCDKCKQILFLATDFFLLCAIQAQSTSLGTHFLVSTPQLSNNFRQEIIFYLSTLSNSEIKVNFCAHLFDRGNETLLLRYVVLERDQVGVVELESIYLSYVDLGFTTSYDFKGDGKFGLCVLIIAEEFSVETYQALPVSGWGRKYIIETLNSTPSVQLINGDWPNCLTVDVRVSSPGLFTASNKAYKVVKDAQFPICLTSFQAFSIANCSDKLMSAGSLSGSLVYGERPFGVVSGNCYSATNDPSYSLDCHTEVTVNVPATGGLTVEMLLPISTLGIEFITFRLLGREMPNKVKAIASDKVTTVLVDWNNFGSNRTYFLSREGDWAYLDLPGTNTRVSSDKAIQLIHVEQSKCRRPVTDQFKADKGDSSLCVIIPVVLFFDNYVWCTPTFRNVSIDHYVLIVVESIERTNLRLDGEHLKTSIKWNTVTGKQDWVVGEELIKPGIHSMHGVDLFYFGCYLCGLAPQFSYMHPAGYIAAPINGPCTKSKTIPGDLTDNDCDRRIDEEKDDKIDNDKDGLIDEDLGKPPRKNGNWGQWAQWSCSRNCLDTRLFRSRKCDDPAPVNEGLHCKANSEEVKPSVCYKNSKCPTTCDIGRWGLNCTFDCANCDPDCDKFEGTCSVCKPGYKFPNESCTRWCDEFEYGIDCMYSCMAKCGADCADRVTGLCGLGIKTPIFILIFIWIIPCTCVYIYVGHKQFKRVKLSEEGEDHNLKRKPTGSRRTSVATTTTVVTGGTTGTVAETVVSGGTSTLPQTS